MCARFAVYNNISARKIYTYSHALYGAQNCIKSIDHFCARQLFFPRTRDTHVVLKSGFRVYANYHLISEKKTGKRWYIIIYFCTTMNTVRWQRVKQVENTLRSILHICGVRYIEIRIFQASSTSFMFIALRAISFSARSMCTRGRIYWRVVIMSREIWKFNTIYYLINSDKLFVND